MIQFVVDVFETNPSFEDKAYDAHIDLPWIGNVGIHLTHPRFWLQLNILLLIQCAEILLFASIIYVFIVKKRKTQGTASLLLGYYGLIIPPVLLLPFYTIEIINLQNVALKLVLVAAPAVVGFRCLESIYGTTPSMFELDFQTFVWYYMTPVPFQVDPKTKQIQALTNRELMEKQARLLFSLVTCLVMFQVLHPVSYKIFPTRPIESFWDLFYWGNLLNNYMLAYLLGASSADVGPLMLGMTISLFTGYSTVLTNDHPLLLSTSPSDFWGRRWNRPVHFMLKRGIYLPLRKHGGFSRLVAALVAFMASGLLHEYVLLILSTQATNNNGFSPNYRIGRHFAFFVWNGMLVCIELAGIMASTAWMKRLPRPVMTALTLMTVLPISHWFTDELLEMGYYSDLAVAFPRIDVLGG